ncbi:acyl transferase domain-containing protein [Pseudoduganella flava]|uniref:Acyl transferase domain-containing protein n=1 Tax=Pseudoduganella flava TaxID=871742 RepID=A0A562PHT3_9BURK|nr:SDR family NAD(P)-dependent oxidoreductase [Pseudoduganella flava]QGZ37636.1 SDR family NAD(P)-dependent oxidoreductase [Pseudoduganella flava]TWI44001.1 acyl transferase domain-containing protein [Pseudoduganella flava]
MNSMNDDVAVIGMSGKFPGANSVPEFWDNLCARKDCVRDLTDDELRAAGVPERDIADPDYVKAAAALDGVDLFDAGFFKVAPLEAELMDPQLRLLLQCAWETLEDAGHASGEAQRIGVFAGAGGLPTSYYSSYANLHERFPRMTASAAQLVNDKDFLATFLSYKLNLTGPSMTVQTACSTSLVALHQARLAVLAGECDMALAGGVSVRVPDLHGYHYQDGFIYSRRGRIRSFDADADGVVFGSGMGLVLIRRFADAVAAGDHIYAVIKGSAILNDGKGKMSYAASSAAGQIACVRTALDKAGVDAASIGFVEAHGTGTRMGDPEEVKALSAAFGAAPAGRPWCALGAVKANVGHLEAAAGIVGFIKAALAIEKGVVPPLAHYTAPNPRIDFAGTPFFVNTAVQAWETGEAPRRAAVNSLGIGGTNAFVILENHVPVPAAAPAGLVIVPLSARTHEALRAGVDRLARFLDGCAARDEAVDLDALAWTLQTGRVAMEVRTAFVAESTDALRQALAAWLAGEPAALPDNDAGRLAAAWAAGGQADWQALRGDRPGRRISLPTYAFARERHWIDGAVATSAAALHPLLHENTSDLREHKYSSTFGGDEFFLKDHQVRLGAGGAPEKVLPAVAYLEMARAACERALPAGTSFELRDVTWLHPLTVSGPTLAHVALVPEEDSGQAGETLRFEVFSSDERIHCQGAFVPVAPTGDAALDLDRLRAAMTRGALTGARVYEAYAAMGLAYGPAKRAVAGIELGDGELLARLKLPAKVKDTRGDYVLHPSLMDGVLQAATVLMFDPASPPARPIVPFALASLRVHAPCGGELYVWARRAEGGGIDVDVVDTAGQPCARLRGYTPRALGGNAVDSLIATRVWEAQAAAGATEAAPVTERHVLLCGLPQVDATALGGHCTMLNVDGADAAERYTAATLACIERLQAIVRAKPQGQVLVRLVAADDAQHALLAGLSGLLKTAQLEHSWLTGQVVLVDADIDTAQLAALLQADDGHAALVRHRRGTREVARWRETARGYDHCPLKDRGVYLITGGLGGLGMLFARAIVERCPAATIVLTGRNPAGAAPAALQALRDGGATVEYRQMDLDDAAAVARVLAEVVAEFGQMNGIVHSAGMTADSFLLNKDAGTAARVLAPKVMGTVNLDQASRAIDLDFLVLFSSLAAALGNLGQGDYAAANGFLDEFAVHRNALVRAGERRGTTVAIQWPLWRDGGMQSDGATRERLFDATGTVPMRTETGMQAFFRLLGAGLDGALVMEGDGDAMRRRLASGHALGDTGAQQTAPAGDLELAGIAEALLCRQLAALLKLRPEQVDPRAALEDYGIDSILALDLTRQLEATFGALPKTLFFEYLTIRELAGYFARHHGAVLAGQGAAPRMAARPVAPAVGPARVTSIRGRKPAAGAQLAAEPIAIVGLAGRYPGGPDVDAFWRNLRDGKDCIVEVPRERWDWREYYSEDRAAKGAHFSKWGGFIDGVDEFDARFFNVSPVEAELIDPQERLFLQHAWLAIEDAGYSRAALQIPNADGLPAQVGVYAGVMYGEYQLLGAEASLQGKRTAFAANPASIANRVSYVLNLHGPSMVVDTMCSSSLTAIHLACQDLKLGRTGMAIAGGVNVTIHPNKYLMLSAGQFISGDGHCQSFGEGGDGYIPGEGVGVVVLKRLSDAQRDGNHIYGVIRGSALSHGGKTNGYTVPNPQAQAAAVRQALAEARVDPRHVSYVEAHGTGTKLGDPIEIAALTGVIRERTADTGYCLIGSAKSNIGHAEAAAGIAGLTKVLLQLRHKQIVPSLHSERLNPHIDFGSTPFVVNQSLCAWEPPAVDGAALPRIAGISSFGAGGSNAHLVIEEYAAPAPAVEEPGWHVFPLSARTPEQLRRKAADLAAFLVGGAVPPAASIAATLQLGREAMDERLAVLADSAQHLRERLLAWLDGGAGDGVWQGNAKANREMLALLTQEQDVVDKWLAAGKLATLAELWAKGLELDWGRLHPVRPQLASLPGYPFARQRYWFDVPRQAPQAAVLHPLLHANTSNFDQHSYTSTFTGDATVLEGPAGARRLSTEGCVAMVRAALAMTLPDSDLTLRDVAWARPQPVVEGVPVTVALFDRQADELAFEIYTAGDVVLCQGRAGKAAAVAAEVAVPVMATAAATVKPQAGIRLAALTEPAHGTAAAAGKPRIALAAAAQQVPAAVELFDDGDGMYRIAVGAPVLDSAVAQALVRALDTVANAPAAKVVTLAASLAGGADACRAARAAGLYEAIARFPYPSIALAAGDTADAGFLAAALCDVIVCAEDARYSARSLPAGAGALLAQRFGAPQAAELLYLSSGATGTTLRAQGWTCPIVPRTEAPRHARELAANLARKSQLALRLLKEELARDIVPMVTALGDIAEEPAPAPLMPLPPVSARLRLASRGDRIAALTVEATDNADGLPEELADAMVAIADAGYRAVVLASDVPGFLPAGLNIVAVRRLGHTLTQLPIGVVASVTAGAQGAGWYVALCCDAASHGEAARYDGGAMADELAGLLSLRLGDDAARQLILTGTNATGAELHALCPAVRLGEDTALQAAQALAALPTGTLPACKQATSAALAAAPLVAALQDDVAAPAPGAVPLRSLVVTATLHADGVVELKMADTDGKNTFTDALSDGLREAFDWIGAQPACKVVVLTGYGNYFSSGGTRDTLLAIGEGARRFTDNLAFRLPLDCPVPVIAAMAGHGIGAGWALGMFADIALFADESRYVSPYMEYGFTPGAGATLVFPRRIGLDLARETLLGARELAGGELKERGLRHAVLPREQVLPAALALARRIAQAPRARLVALKARWAAPLVDALPATFVRELAMHERTFVGQQETLAKIRLAGTVAAVAAEVSTRTGAPVRDAATLAAELRRMLAQELRMQEHEIGDDEQFVDLGLDSITGVTWIRRINETYGTAIEAIRIYSYPTLGKLAAFVLEQCAPAAAQPAIDGDPVEATLRTLLAQELRMAEADIGSDDPFVDLGLDSITGVTWIRRINETFGTAIDAIRIYSYPSLRQLARYVQQEAGERAPVAAPVEEVVTLTSMRGRMHAVVPVRSHETQRVAVVGMAGQFAQSPDLAAFWRNIAAGRDCITEIPRERWDIDRYYQPGDAAAGKTYSRWMGALDGVDHFDAAFFNISPREARAMDPQQRLFLQTCWHTIEHAGYNPRALAGSRCGVFVGCAAGDYHELSRHERLSGQGFTGGAPSILAARISYLLDLHGPSMAIDTACSSSLVALAAACDSLVLGTSDIALAGGVNVMAGPAMQIMTAQVGMLSPQGRCYAFDARANGIVNGEGVGAVLLKRLADAERDGDHIYGVIEGWGTNQDGKTNGITAPNADSQARLQQDVYHRFGIDPDGIGLVEAHGTGTALGDPIEVAGLKDAFGRYTDRRGFCALGSVKSNIGHCLSAAGISGFLKVLLALQHRQLPPTAQFERLNPHIALDESPFRISDRLRDWPAPAGAPRRAAVNAFGFSGTNAHVVVAEYGVPAVAAPTTGPAIVPLSARTPDALRRAAADLLAFLEDPEADLASIAYTLQTGREALTERVAFVAASVAELREGLRAYADGGTAAAGTVATGLAKDGQEAAACIGRKDWAALAALWVGGGTVDWAALYVAGPAPRRIGLPGYPFAAERHWIDTVDQEFAEVIAVPASSAAAVPPATGAPVVPIEQVRQQLKATLAEALFMQPADIDIDRSFTELGLDSIIGVEWMKAVNKAFGTALSATRVYDYPSVRELAAHVQAQLGEAPAAVAVEVTPSAPVMAPRPAAPASADLERQLKASLAEALFMQPGDIDANRSFTELGLDSIIGVEWMKAVNRRFGTSLSATRIYDYPTVKELAAFLQREVAVETDVAPHFAIVATDGDLERDGEVAVRYAISLENNVCLREHVVFGEHLLPTDAYLELVYGAWASVSGGPVPALEQVAIVSPLLGARDRDIHVQVRFRRHGAAVQFSVRSSAQADFRDERVHMQGLVAAAQPAAIRCDGHFAVEHELGAADIPTNAGTCYAPLRALRFGTSQATGEIHVAEHPYRFATNPFVLYGAVCTAINYGRWLAARQYGVSNDQFLPVRIGRVTPLRELAGADYRCHAALRRLERDVVECYVEIVDAEGALVAVFDTLELRRVAQQAIARVAAPMTSAPADKPAAEADDIAIIGMSCRYPQSADVDAFWRNLAAGRECIVEVPAERWADHPGWYHPEPGHPHTSYSKWAGLLDRIDAFDPLFFGIAPAEAELIDPQQRIFLEECWKAIENAGYAPGALANVACGVYVGCGAGDYARVLAGAGQDTAGAAFMGTSTAIQAARIAYHLNLKGPALAIDTACSSSLVAVHLACESLRSGETQLALAGGVNVLTTPLGHILTSQVGMPSHDGRCAAFDASADGIVFSEGCGVLLLKPLAAARRDNDEILGVIRASAINQDGKTNGITAPSGAAQERLLRQAYGKFGIDPKRIGYVEAHGTATPLGDPIEVNALTAVYNGAGAGKGACALGSVKTNIGHTGYAAGVAGIIKAVLCMRHRKLVPSLHYDQPNPHIAFDGSPFHVNTAYRDWASAAPRLAAVSSFGFSGTNAHVVIGEHVAATETPASARPVLVPLSAKTPEQLANKVADLLDYLEHDEQVDLVRLAYTLSVGRDAMDHRLALVVGSVEELVAALRGWQAGKPGMAVRQGQASRDGAALAVFAGDAAMQGVIDGWIARGDLGRLADIWVRGMETDLGRLYPGEPPRRMVLPAYPFARERCWVEGKAAAARETLHPLLHRNVSDLTQQRYASLLTGGEFFVAGHRVNGAPVLPAVAFLEMARAALADAAHVPAAQLELRHVAWAQPLAVTAPTDVSIAVFEEDGGYGFEVYSGVADVPHCQGSCVAAVGGAAQPLDVALLRARMPTAGPAPQALYEAFARIGLDYGPAFRGITQLNVGNGELLAALELPAAADNGADWVLHPSLLDSALQAGVALLGDVVGGAVAPCLPFAVEAVRVHAPCPPRMLAWVRGTGTNATLVKVDIDLCDGAGNVCVQLRGFSSRPLRDAAFDEVHYQTVINAILNNDITVDDAVELGNV